MLKRHSQVFEVLFAASDLLVISAAWLLSYWVRFNWGVIPAPKGIPLFDDYVRMLVFVWLIWALVFRWFGLYRPMRGASRLREAWSAAKANALCVLMLLAATYLFREKNVPFSRLVFLIFGVLSTGAAIGSRSLLRGVLRAARRRGYNLRTVLIVGSGELAAGVARRVEAHPEYGLALLGCLRRGDGEPQQSPPADLEVIGDYDDLPALIQQSTVDQIIVALPFCDHHLTESVLSSLGDTMIDVRIVPDYHGFIRLGSQVEEFDGLPVISVASTPLCGINQVAKRGVDLVLGTICLVLTAPVVLVTAIVIKLTSRGPVFFSQERVGLDGRPFTIYKLRTMSADADADGARFAVQGDPRVTPVGRWLRRLNIDELPQLLNVVLGHMSLVGPRPERNVFVQKFRRDCPDYMLRHKVQAGMTGWAQVNGWRGDTSIEQRIAHDLYYIENWSFALDLKILGLTLLKSFRDRNAY